MKIEIDASRLEALSEFETLPNDAELFPGLMPLVGELLSAGRASLMLLDSDGEAAPRLKLVALHGKLPKSAWDEKLPVGKGVAGKVFLDGQPLLVQDMRKTSSLKTAMRHPDEPASFIVCPVLIRGNTAGVLNLSAPTHTDAFQQDDLSRALIVAKLVGRIVLVQRLQGVLDSNFAQMAMVQGGVTDSSMMVALGASEPQKIARMLAKSFYREMRRCGFSFNQILQAASEVISELTHSLDRTKQRQRKSNT